jgi:serine/threonine-protein kinase
MSPTNPPPGRFPADDDNDDDDGLDEATEIADVEPGRGGRRIAGRYTVLHALAKGGMGEVLLASHVDLGRLVALKVMAPPKSEHQIDFTDRFRTEARTLAGFVHPHIVTVHDFGVLEDGRCFLAMEYVDGRTLAEELKKGPLAPTRAVRLALQVCSALRYAHERGVVHRDLTPSNLLLAGGPDRTEHVKLVDWGIAKVSNVDAEETQGGVILGSPHVMAPEQIDGVGVDPRTDVYQLGVVLFRMLTGVYPFRGNAPMAILMAHLDQPIPRFAEVAPDVEVPEGIEAVVRRCLAKERSERWPGIDALREELAAVLALPESAYRTAPTAPAREPAVPVRPPAPEPVAALPARPFPWGIMVAAIVVGALALAVAGTALGVRIGRRAAEAPVPVSAPAAQVAAPDAPEGSAAATPATPAATPEPATPEPASARPKASG